MWIHTHTMHEEHHMNAGGAEYLSNATGSQQLVLFF